MSYPTRHIAMDVHRFSVFVWTGENDSNTLPVDYFKRRLKGISVLKSKGILVERTLVVCFSTVADWSRLGI